MPRQLLVETAPFLVESVEEDSKSKILRVKGIFGQAEEPNRNKRIYTLQEMKREIERTRPVIEARGMVGELDHPPDLQIHLQNVSHVIADHFLEGNLVRGTLEVLPTPKGKILEGLILSNVRTGISSRGTGDFEGVQRGGADVVCGFELITWDAVAEPSANKAYLERFRESLQRQAKALETMSLEEATDRKIMNPSEIDDIRKAVDQVIEAYLSKRGF